MATATDTTDKEDSVVAISDDGDDARSDVLRLCIVSITEQSK